LKKIPNLSYHKKKKKKKKEPCMGLIFIFFSIKKFDIKTLQASQDGCCIKWLQVLSTYFNILRLHTKTTINPKVEEICGIYIYSEI